MKICIAGEGAQGQSYLKSLQSIDGIEVASVAGGNKEALEKLAREWSIPHYSQDLAECLAQPGVEAVILATPNNLHFQQSKQAIELGKHVLVEIPMGVDVTESARLAELGAGSGLKCMVAHTVRFQPMMREIYDRVQDGRFHPHQINFTANFFRRDNMNRFGVPRGWKDDILWHHGCHFVDYAYWLFGDNEEDIDVWAHAGVVSEKLGCPLDLTLAMRSSSGCLMSANLSYNTHGPLDWVHRFIGEEDTYRVYEGERTLNHKDEVVLTEGDEIATFILQLEEFFGAIKEDREPLTSFANILPVMKLLNRMETQITQLQS